MKQTKKNILIAFATMLISLLLSSCSGAPGIFKAGMSVGVFAVLSVVAIITVLTIDLNKK